MEPTFLHQLGSILRPGDYDIASLLIQPRKIDMDNTPFSLRTANCNEFSTRDWEKLFSCRFSDDQYYQCELAAAAEEELAPVLGDNLKDFFGNSRPKLFVLHTIATLQPIESLDEERVAEYEGVLKAGVPCTAWAISRAFLDDNQSYNRNPWHKAGLMSFLLDGHHKMCAAARARLPLRLLVFVPRFQRSFEPLEYPSLGPKLQADSEAGAENSPSPSPLWNLEELHTPIVSALAALDSETRASFNPPSMTGVCMEGEQGDD